MSFDSSARWHSLQHNGGVFKQRNHRRESPLGIGRSALRTRLLVERCPPSGSADGYSRGLHQVDRASCCDRVLIEWFRLVGNLYMQLR
jgi:hypothetical protein